MKRLGVGKIFDKIKKFYRENLVISEEDQLTIAQKNIQKLYKVHPLIILACIILLIIQNFHFRNNPHEFQSRLFYYTLLIAGSLLALGGCFIIKKNPNMKPKVQMFPTHFSFTYIYLLICMLIYNNSNGEPKDLFIPFIIFACISVITPMFFDIEPFVYYFLEFALVISMSIKTVPVLDIPITICIYVFTILTTTLSFLKWKISKRDYNFRKTQREYTDRMEREIALASLVQTSFFKHEDTLYKDWTVVYYTKAMSGVSGDFIDFYNNHSKSLEGIGIFDVSGHGIASGLVTMLVKNIITKEFYKGKKDSLKTVIDRINVRYINEKGSIENYLTGILCRIEDNTVNFVNAGHSLPILYKNDEEQCIEINDKPNEKSFGAIGLPDMPNNFIEHSVTMNSGDELILFTDGITDTSNEDNISFGRERLIRSINRNADRPLQTQINCIISDVTNFGHGKPLEDDITMIILKKK